MTKRPLESQICTILELQSVAVQNFSEGHKLSPGHTLDTPDFEFSYAKRSSNELLRSCTLLWFTSHLFCNETGNGERKRFSDLCSTSPSAGHFGYLHHYQGMLGPRPGGPSHGPLRGWAPLWDRGGAGQAVEPQLLGWEDPIRGAHPRRHGDPRGGGEDLRNPEHHSCGLLCERQEVRRGSADSFRGLPVQVSTADDDDGGGDEERSSGGTPTTAGVWGIVLCSALAQPWWTLWFSRLLECYNMLKSYRSKKQNKNNK